jgi:hypothetical protein
MAFILSRCKTRGLAADQSPGETLVYYQRIRPVSMSRNIAQSPMKL